MSTKQLHALILFFFVCLSIFLTLGKMGTAFDSFALLNQDLGVYASLAAAQEYPQLFERDPFLSDEKNTNSYNMLFVPLLKALEDVFGNYGTACAFLVPFLLFFHLSGYYLLGVTIFKNPWAGLLVSLLLSAPTNTSLDFWGLLLDALPRFMYQALLPFVLVLSIRYGQNPKWWPVILGGVGLLNYVHPLSTPAWTVAILLGLWLSVPHLRFREKAGRMLVAVLVLLVILSPFISNYFTSTILETSQSISYDQTMSILQSHMSTLGNASTLALFFAGRPGYGFDIIWYCLWLLGISGLVWGLLRNREAGKNIPLYQLAAWMIGILLVSGLLPILEGIIFAYLKQIPPEFELVRTLRYSVPLILLAAVFTIKMAADQLGENRALPAARTMSAFISVSILLLLVWGISSQGKGSEFYRVFRQNLRCWLEGQLVCDLAPANMDFIDVMNVIREETPVGARVFSEGQEVAVRYYALRPLVFTYKDGAPLAYTNQEQLLIWKQTYDEMDQLSFIRKFPFRHRAFIKEITELAHSVGSDYLLLHEAYQEAAEYPEQLSIVYTNDHYTLFKIAQP